MEEHLSDTTELNIPQENGIMQNPRKIYEAAFVALLLIIFCVVMFNTVLPASGVAKRVKNVLSNSTGLTEQDNFDAIVDARELVAGELITLQAVRGDEYVFGSDEIKDMTVTVDDEGNILSIRLGDNPLPRKKLLETKTSSETTGAVEPTTGALVVDINKTAQNDTTMTPTALDSGLIVLGTTQSSVTANSDGAMIVESDVIYTVSVESVDAKLERENLFSLVESWFSVRREMSKSSGASSTVAVEDKQAVDVNKIPCVGAVYQYENRSGNVYQEFVLLMPTHNGQTLLTIMMMRQLDKAEKPQTFESLAESSASFLINRVYVTSLPKVWIEESVSSSAETSEQTVKQSTDKRVPSQLR